MHYSNARSEDLARAFISPAWCYTNKNHTTEIKDAQRAFDPSLETCAHCALSARCFGNQVDIVQAMQIHCPCIMQKAAIEFYYHNSLCLQFEIPKNRITDKGMWIRSRSTTRAIGWYLVALEDHGFITAEQVKDLKKRFKTRTTSQWVYL
jgi:hypothetical protein